MKKERREIAKVNKKLRDKTKRPNTSLSALETEIQSKTTRQIDSLSSQIDSKKQGRAQKAGNKKKNETVSKIEKKKSEEIQKAKGELTGQIKESEEAKELQNKTSSVLGDSALLLKSRPFEVASGLDKYKNMSTDTLKKEIADTIKNRAIEEARTRGTAEAMKVEEVAEGKQYLDQITKYKNDSAAIDHLAEDLVNKSEYGKEIGKLGGQQDGLQQAKAQTEQMDQQLKEMQALKDKEQMQKYAKEKAAKLANADLAKFAPQVQEAQQQFSQYKKKMEWLKEGSEPKANSLKDEPLLKRFIYGGNFQIPEIEPLSIVAAPFIGYRINKKFSSGVGVSYKVIVGKNTFYSKAFGGEIGYRVFTDYKLIKNWFAHGEFERMSKTIRNSTGDGTITTWKNNGYIGVGRQMEISKGLKMNVMFLCNVLHEDLKDFNMNAFQFRFGISK